MILFITGNDTDIGKTFATSIILSSFLNSSSKKKYKKIAVVKPVESGVNKKINLTWILLNNLIKKILK